VCFAPVENPRIAVVVTVESPKEGADLYGGTYAAPIAREILREYFKDYPEALFAPASTPVAKN
jgi:penicillin-binding protein 2